MAAATSHLTSKGPNHSRITGDFAEAFLLYWLSKNGYECMRVDHVGIDLIARPPDGSEIMAISVKCRSRSEKTKSVSVNLPPDGFEKAEKTCKAFRWAPYYAVMVDDPERIQCFLVPLAHLRSLVGDDPARMHYWQMSSKAIASYRGDPLIRRFELQTVACSWRDVVRSTSGDQAAI